MSRTTASIPVALENPGQMLACMGFLEAAEVLCGGVQAHFDWREAGARFVLCAEGNNDPFQVVLDFLATAKVIEVTPIGYVEGGAADGDDDEEREATPSDVEDGEDSEGDDASDQHGRITAPAFPSGEGDRNSLPIQLVADGHRITVSHWADGSSRDQFKLYSGNRSARQVAERLLGSLSELWKIDSTSIVADPFGRTVPLGGSFNFDARRAWTGIDAGFSPDQQKKNNRMLAGVAGSPVVEMLAVIGLEHARPDEYETRKVRYAVWNHPLPPMLARAALSGADLTVPLRRFQFKLSGTKHSKVVTFAQEETHQ